MSLIGNILWLIFGGFFSGLSWIFFGCVWCITIVGIPIGKQCFKFAKVSFSPFGKEIVYTDSGISVLLNVVWMLVSGFWMALGNIAMGTILYITIIGIPFGKQFFKLARLSLFPFGAKVY
ncbi:MAG: YccF domain-containing protein [Erysipelotrichaceae bacterium]|nr:YccF domain-containing protein [Erysipelotrichaceae bacterium]